MSIRGNFMKRVRCYVDRNLNSPYNIEPFDGPRIWKTIILW